MKSRGLPAVMLSLLGAVFLLAAAAMVVFAFSRRSVSAASQSNGGDNGLPVFYHVPRFSLTTQAGGTLSRDDLKGQVWVANFIFTRCRSICPINSANMAKLQEQLDGDPRWKSVRLVSFSVDPGYDRPPVLRRYAQAHHANPARWTFLTGERPTLWRLIRNGFKLTVQSAPKNSSSLILHTGRWVLVDRRGRIRGYYDGLTPKGRMKLMTDLHKLLPAS